MRGLDYRSVVSQKPEFDFELKAYVLQLGSLELEPISYSTLLTLRDRPALVREVLERCFIDGPAMWADPADVSPSDCRAQLGDLEAQLAAIDSRLQSAGRPCDDVLARIIELWQGLTLEAVWRLEKGAGSEVGVSAQSIVADYRRAAFAFVEALLQLLPDENQCSIEVREKLEEAKARLVDVLRVEREHIEDAGWRTTKVVRDSEDPGFVTWGIP